MGFLYFVSLESSNPSMSPESRQGHRTGARCVASPLRAVRRRLRGVMLDIGRFADRVATQYVALAGTIFSSGAINWKKARGVVSPRRASPWVGPGRLLAESDGIPRYVLSKGQTAGRVLFSCLYFIFSFFLFVYIFILSFFMLLRPRFHA